MRGGLPIFIGALATAGGGCSVTVSEFEILSGYAVTGAV